MIQQGKHLIVITGAAGTGKTTVSHYLESKYHVIRVLTHTTRPPRKGEMDGRDYYFETKDSFFSNHFIEHVAYAGFLYGSSREGLQRAFKQGNVACLVLDTKGAQTYLREFSNCVDILFLTVPDLKLLRLRMQQRGDSAMALEHRLASKEYRRDLHLPEDMKQRVTVIVNDNLSTTKTKIDRFMARILR